MKVRKKIKFFKRIDINAIEEKFKKYGNQRRNSFITLAVVILSAFIVYSLYLHSDKTNNKYGYINFYPQNTTFYIEVTPSDMHRYNFGAPIWWQILLKNMLINTNTKISYGSWKMRNGKTAKMLVLPITNKILIQKGLELFSGEEAKSSIYKGFKIYNYTNKGMYLFLSNKDAFISDNVGTIKEFIDNSDSSMSSSFLTQSKTKYALKYIDRENNDFLILTDHSRLFSQLNQLSNRKFEYLLDFYKENPKFIKMTIATIKNKKDLSEIESYNFLDESKIKNPKIKNILKKLIKKNSTEFNLDFLPEKTIGFISVSNCGYLLDLFLELNNSKNNETKSFKKLIQEVTHLDYEKELINVLNNNLTILLVPDSSGQVGVTGVLVNEKDTDKVISGLIKLISIQVPNAKFSRINYKKIELNMITLNENLIPLIFGRIKPDLYVFGEKNAVEALIDSTLSKKTTKFDKLEYYKDFIVEHPEFYFYLNNKQAKKYERLKSINKNLPENFNKNIKEVLYSTTIEEDKIKSILLLYSNN